MSLFGNLVQIFGSNFGSRLWLELCDFGLSLWFELWFKSLLGHWDFC